MKKIIFTLLALVGTMSMNAQIMKIMKGNTVVATYRSTQADNVVFEEAPTFPFGQGEAEATIDGKTVYVKWIQLWENGPKFAEYNVGATSVADYGGYYTWGGTYKNGKDIAWNGDYNTGTSKLSGDTDTATKLWGSNWRMPTNDELGKYDGDGYYMDPVLCGGLLYECTCTMVTNYNGTGVSGLLCTGKGDYESNSIFLPAAGFSESSSGVGKVYGLGSRCDYWTSIPKPEGFEYDEHAYSLSHGNQVDTNFYRSQGISVRAVLNE